MTCFEYFTIVKQAKNKTLIKLCSSLTRYRKECVNRKQMPWEWGCKSILIDITKDYNFWK